MTRIAIAAYVYALVAANLSIAHFGPSSIPVNAFLFIGLDLALRDYLHARLTRASMLGVIALAGGLTYVLSPAAGHIALASAVAFTVSAMVDWGVFSAARNLPWTYRSNASNVAGAFTDSLVFPAVAGFGIGWAIFGPMLAAKIAGGIFWTWVLRRRATQ